MGTHQDTITEELARHGSTAEIENMHIINEAPEMQKQKMQNATDKLSRLQHLVNGLNQKLTKAKNDTLTQLVKCEKNTTNASGVSVLTAIDEVALAHRSAKIARILYVRQLEGNRNKTMLLKQLDDEAMESVPEYGSKL